MARWPARAGAMCLLLAATIQTSAIGAAEGAPQMTAQAQQNEPRKVFRGVGIVTAIEPAGSLTINHEPIEGLMPAMEMAFQVNPRTLANGVRPGDKIEFSVEGKTYTIVAVKIVGHTE
ncbi:MAG TPA: copper-binding protein [Acetobacteraceae bacterium]|jgi:Cu/Ag efflux protein CusF|nr:copper-binding protein [Acetobacteraceae bacterium]